MTDRYQQFARSGIGSWWSAGSACPTRCRCGGYAPGQSLLAAPHCSGRAAAAGWLEAVAAILPRPTPTSTHGGGRAATAHWCSTRPASTGPDQVRELYDFFHPVIRQLGSCGRVLVLGTPPEERQPAGEKVAQRALEGFTRSVGKELRRGSTAQLVYVAKGAEHARRVDRPVPAVRQVGLRVRPGGADRRGKPETVVAPDNWAHAAGRRGRAGDRRVARHRRRDRRGAGPRRRARRVPGRARAGRGPVRGGQRGRRDGRAAGHHRDRRARPRWSSTSPRGTAAWTSWCTTPASRGTASWPRWTPPGGMPCSAVNLAGQVRDQRRAAGEEGAARPTEGSSASRRSPGSPATSARPTTPRRRQA